MGKSCAILREREKDEKWKESEKKLRIIKDAPGGGQEDAGGGGKKEELKKNAAEQGDTNVQDELKKTAEQGCCVMLNQKIDELSQKVDQLSLNVDQLLENFSVFSKMIQDEFKVIHDVLSTTTE
jgi:hypothetical protein